VIGRKSSASALLFLVVFAIFPGIVGGADSAAAPGPSTRPIPKGLAGVGLTADQVNLAIDKGAAFLWQYLKTKDLAGSYKLGSDREHVLCALALVHAGAAKKYPDFDAALREYLGSVDAESLGGYQSGILNMLIDSYGDPSYLPKLRQSARYLLESQGSSGTFTYTVNVDPKAYSDEMTEGPLRVSGRPPPESSGLAPRPWTRQTDWSAGADGDDSVTQFAMLGLESACRVGIKFPPDTWSRPLDELHARLDDDGGWAYHGRAASYGSMTCAGIGIRAIALHELGKDPNADPDIQSGLNWLDKNFTVSDNPGKSDWAMYYLYSLERTGRLLDTEFIGDHEWYPLGARYLVDSQKPDGSWIGKSDEQDPRLATSFALLFLTRATANLAYVPHPDLKGALKTAVVPPPGLRLYFILDCSGSMLDMMQGRQKFQIVRGAVAKVISILPDNCQVALRAYGHRKSALDPDCDLDTELLIPMGPFDRKLFMQKLSRLHARGKTPLTLSLEFAKQEIPDDGKPTSVVLLTDGGEDTFPPRDPVPAARDLVAVKGVTLDIVGFDIGNHVDWYNQLKRMTAASHGRYWSATHGDDLIQNLQSAILKTPKAFAVLDKDGKQVAAGKFGATVALPEGQYTFQTDYLGRKYEKPFWITGGENTGIEFDAAAIEHAQQAPKP
jgi:hypothetical protein